MHELSQKFFSLPNFSEASCQKSCNSYEKNTYFSEAFKFRH